MLYGIDEEKKISKLHTHRHLSIKHTDDLEWVLSLKKNGIGENELEKQKVGSTNICFVIIRVKWPLWNAWKA